MAGLRLVLFLMNYHIARSGPLNHHRSRHIPERPRADKPQSAARTALLRVFRGPRSALVLLVYCTYGSLFAPPRLPVLLRSVPSMISPTINAYRGRSQTALRRAKKILWSSRGASLDQMCSLLYDAIVCLSTAAAKNFHITREPALLSQSSVHHSRIERNSHRPEMNASQV